MLMNIGEVTYDCGMWQINGLPCKHVVTVFMYNRVFLHDHVYWYYTKEAMKLAYNGAINAIPKESRLPEYHCEHIDPPTKRMKVARPKKIRKKAHDEPPAQSKIFSNRSQTCKTIGHNSCTCKDKDGNRVSFDVKMDIPNGDRRHPQSGNSAHSRASTDFQQNHCSFPHDGIANGYVMQ
ncbi:hypothetical protein LWI28_021314 [Acer negundo]|uniref:Zinc finger PMZ-type domain-containing protein n=1 Tax=Acer negundo TaxID=4023 RepID=A0AAD5IKI5_ACENE|nr:hypothetical protein LWI28_021314 [Acer negundo]